MLLLILFWQTLTRLKQYNFNTRISYILKPESVWDTIKHVPCEGERVYFKLVALFSVKMYKITQKMHQLFFSICSTQNWHSWQESLRKNSLGLGKFLKIFPEYREFFLAPLFDFTGFKIGQLTYSQPNLIKSKLTSFNLTEPLTSPQLIQLNLY